MSGPYRTAAPAPRFRWPGDWLDRLFCRLFGHEAFPTELPDLPPIFCGWCGDEVDLLEVP